MNLDEKNRQYLQEITGRDDLLIIKITKRQLAEADLSWLAPGCYVADQPWDLKKEGWFENSVDVCLNKNKFISTIVNYQWLKDEIIQNFPPKKE